MLPYHKSRALHQERMNRYQSELKRAAERRSSGPFDQVAQALGSGLANLARRAVSRPAV